MLQISMQLESKLDPNTGNIKEQLRDYFSDKDLKIVFKFFNIFLLEICVMKRMSIRQLEQIQICKKKLKASQLERSVKIFLICINKAKLIISITKHYKNF